MTQEPATRRSEGNMNDNYIVPQELVDLLEEAAAAEEARDSAVKGFFKFQVRNAVYLGTIARKKKREFWSQLRELYPDLKDTIIYDQYTKTVSNKAD